MPHPVVPFQRPYLPPIEQFGAYLSRSYADRWFSNAGPCARLLRERLGERVGHPALPVASATAGLLIAIAALVDRDAASERREVLLPSFTFAATIQAALWAGLTPRFLDIDRDHWHLDADALEATLGDRGQQVALVIAVTSFGTPPPPEVLDRWQAACRAADVPLLVDAAAGFGAEDAAGRKVGTLGDVDVVSFHATKPFAVGEGGAIFTADPDLMAAMEGLANFGLDASGRIVRPHGLNAKMSELHAAVALSVLDDFESILAARRRAAAAVVGPRDGVTLQAESERSTWQFVPVAFPDERARIDAVARSRDTVETRRYYRPLHHMERFADTPVGAGDLAATDDLAHRLLCLPMANDLTLDEIDAVSAVIHPD